MKRILVDDLHREWMKTPGYRWEYKALEEEFSRAGAFVEARTRAGLTQEQVAKRMKTTQAVIARLEAGGSKPSTRTLEKWLCAGICETPRFYCVSVIGAARSDEGGWRRK